MKIWRRSLQVYRQCLQWIVAWHFWRTEGKRKEGRGEGRQKEWRKGGRKRERRKKGKQIEKILVGWKKIMKRFIRDKVGSSCMWKSLLGFPVVPVGGWENIFSKTVMSYDRLFFKKCWTHTLNHAHTHCSAISYVLWKV